MSEYVPEFSAAAVKVYHMASPCGGFTRLLHLALVAPAAGKFSCRIVIYRPDGTTREVFEIVEFEQGLASLDIPFHQEHLDGEYRAALYIEGNLVGEFKLPE